MDSVLVRTVPVLVAVTESYFASLNHLTQLSAYKQFS